MYIALMLMIFARSVFVVSLWISIMFVVFLLIPVIRLSYPCGYLSYRQDDVLFLGVTWNSMYFFLLKTATLRHDLYPDNCGLEQ